MKEVSWVRSSDIIHIDTVVDWPVAKTTVFSSFRPSTAL